MYVLEWSTRGAAGTHQEQTEKIIVLPGLAILTPLKVCALCPGTGGTALFTALLPKHCQFIESINNPFYYYLRPKTLDHPPCSDHNARSPRKIAC
ncbi:hypothetical protein EVAR_36149_1 [Eumeta japonica]|uniref:Uncharacterized protein n=1 Tax=Eumeta variegata TaxID=151549 RepID=A0A4C1X5D8_EUMVA|nr:hypothetical protein EVAR_36149_1 [Eumeta japonica]